MISLRYQSTPPPAGPELEGLGVLGLHEADALRRQGVEDRVVDLGDDGDLDARTQCSYTGELEGVAYDSISRTLFLLNTVNMPLLDPPVDKPALFRLRKKHGRGRFRLVDWRAHRNPWSTGLVPR